MDLTTSLSRRFADLSVDDQNLLHEHVVALDRVSPERDFLVDADHKSLDATIMKQYSAFRRFNEEPDLASLLSSITAGDQRLSPLTVHQAEELLSSQPAIRLLLQKAWQNASFHEIRRLSALWPKVPETPKRHHLPSNEDFELTNKALQSAWHDTYLGNNHRLLFDNINAIPRTEKPYSNQIAIVQSSGTGKSRMVHEQAKLVFTIPFNLREMSDNRDLAFPIPDNAVRNYLVATDDQHIVKVNYLKFLGSVFTQVDRELEKCQEELREKQVKTAEHLARWWSRHLEGIRKELYKAAIVGAGKDIKILSEIQKRHDELLAKRRSKPEDSEDAKNVVEFAAAETARAALGQLITRLDGWPVVRSQRIKLIVYFDEAHPLTKVTPRNDDGKTLYDFLCLCLNQFLAFPIFCIFLSTNSGLAHFASPQALAKSARIRGGDAATNPPITETPFDCCCDLMVKPGGLSIKDISTIPFMAQFGRSLFWTLLRGAGLKAPELYREVLELARAKLVASCEIDSSYNTFSYAARLAVIDVQLSLDFEPRRDKVRMEEAGLVESHMRIAYSIPEHREYLRSGYPSEPLLAEAAAQQLWMWRTKNPFMVVETLADVLETGLLSRGELEELVGRQLLLDAYHRAVELEQSDRPKTTPPSFSAGCRLINFIRMLFIDECADKVLNSTPDNMGGMSFKDVFKDALVCFTHFGKMADATGVTSAAAWAAFIRHMAIIGHNTQKGVDCVLPVLLWDTQLCEHVMTGLLVRFKRQKIEGGTIAEYSIEQAEFDFFPKSLEQCTHRSNPTSDGYRPYVSLVMELGIQPNAAKEANPDGSSSKKSAHLTRTPPIEGGADHGTPSKLYVPQEGHARYNVFAYGCSPTVYRGIDEAHKASYALLLSCRDFLGEHPRTDPETLKAVRRMKPFWSRGEDSYHWIERDAILHGPPEDPPRVEFFVGNQMQSSFFSSF